ncbi:MAG TPA: hypothetical protein VF835_06335 [Rhizomicrobium sp.]
MTDPTTLERAFELARTGNYKGIGEIRHVLLSEGLSRNQLDGSRSLQKQLRAVCVATRRARGVEPAPAGRRKVGAPDTSSTD